MEGAAVGSGSGRKRSWNHALQGLAGIRQDKVSGVLWLHETPGPGVRWEKPGRIRGKPKGLKETEGTQKAFIGLRRAHGKALRGLRKVHLREYT